MLKIKQNTIRKISVISWNLVLLLELPDFTLLKFEYLNTFELPIAENTSELPIAKRRLSCKMSV